MLEGTAVLWEEFQSTLPVRGATKPGIQRIRIKGISIHAPREGSDSSFPSTLFMLRIFQSTLPVRGATLTTAPSTDFPKISIHAPREGSDSETAQRHRYVL